ncbi:unnamed protein product [Bursaphelenchus xylophilus]|nr:unnamed protein product [Bursaphelenchus xylophilus]CAG9129978.1 unnamed protein product [Bursaphelenchus xylophilus]
MVTTTEKGIDVYEAGPDAPFAAVPDKPNEPSFMVGHDKDKFPAYVLELNPKNDTESIKEKFNRLKSDAFLLHEQIEREALKDETPVQIRPVDELKFLINSLKKTIETPSE